MMFADKLLIQIEMENKKAVAQAKKMEESIKKIASNEQQRNMLQFGLSALFTGMAIKRLGESIMKSLVTTYMTATNWQQKFHQQLLGVQASFEFLKFSIVDALSQSDFVVAFIERFIELVNWVAEFTNKHPMIATMIAAFALGAAVLGGLSMVIGQTYLGLLGLAAAVELFKKNWILVKAAGIITFLKEMAVAGWAAMAPYLPLIAVLAVIAGALFLLKQHTGSWGNAFKAVGIFILAILAYIGDGIYEAIIQPVRIVIALLNAVIKANNALAKTKLGKKAGLSNIATIAQPESMQLSKKVWEMRNELLAEGEKIKNEDAVPTSITVPEININMPNITNATNEQDIKDAFSRGFEAVMEEYNIRKGGTTSGS